MEALARYICSCKLSMKSDRPKRNKAAIRVQVRVRGNQSRNRSRVRGNQSRNRFAIINFLPRIEACKSTEKLDLSDLNLNNSDVEAILNYVTKKNIKVQTLDLSNNKLTTLPESIGHLKYLTELLLNKNHLTTLPESIGLLKSLRFLYLVKNHLTTLPESIGQLATLRLLSVEDNYLTTLPESIGQLLVLRSLDLTSNYLTISFIRFQDGRTVTIGDQKNEQEIRIIYEKVCRYIENLLGQLTLEETFNPAVFNLGQLTLEETFNLAVFNSLDKSEGPININNKNFLYPLISYLQVLEKHQAIKTVIGHLKSIASERKLGIPDSVAEVAT